MALRSMLPCTLLMTGVGGERPLAECFKIRVTIFAIEDRNVYSNMRKERSKVYMITAETTVN